MVASAEYQVLTGLKSALEDITVANGFNTEVRQVEFYDESAEELPVTPSIEIEAVSTREDQTKCATENWVFMTVALGLAVEDYADEHETVGQFIADVKDKLLGQAPQFFDATLSSWLRIESTVRIHPGDGDPRAGAAMVLTILFIHPLKDAFTLTP